MDPKFQAHLIATPSLSAAQAMIRTLVERRKLLSDQDTHTFVMAAADGSREAARIALDGLKLIEAGTKRRLADVPEAVAVSYIDWLGAFALQRAAAGRNSSPDRGRTLLAALRQVSTGTSRSD